MKLFLNSVGQAATKSALVFPFPRPIIERAAFHKLQSYIVRFWRVGSLLAKRRIIYILLNWKITACYITAFCEAACTASIRWSPFLFCFVWFICVGPQLFILLLRCRGVHFRCAIFRTFSSFSLFLSHFCSVLCKQEIRLLLFWILLAVFPPPTLHFVSEFLAVFPASRFSISPSALPSHAFSPTLRICIRICAIPSICARASRVIISIHDCDANFYCFPSRRLTVLSPSPAPSHLFSRFSLLLLLPSNAFCPFSAVAHSYPRVLRRIIFYFACLCRYTEMFLRLVLCNTITEARI